MNPQHTPGPWRWEYNEKNKCVHIVGGKPTYDLTVVDFSRWGMNMAVPRFRDTSLDGMNLMDRLCDKPEWIAPAVGREHHKSWFQLVTHPDAKLIEAAPDLLQAVRMFMTQTNSTEHADAYDKGRNAIFKATGGLL